MNRLAPCVMLLMTLAIFGCGSAAPPPTSKTDSAITENMTPEAVTSERDLSSKPGE